MNPIEINRDSWHGRITRYFFGNDHIQDTPSICPYFWSVWAAVIFSPIKFVVLKTEDWGHWTKAFVGVIFTLLIIGSIYNPIQTIYFSIYMISMFTFCQINIWVSDWYKEHHPYRKSYPPQPKQRKEKQPTFIEEWLKAKKGKFCPPIIEVTN